MRPKIHNQLLKILGDSGKVELTPSLEALDTIMHREALAAPPPGAHTRFQHSLCFHGGDGSVSRGITSFIRHYRKLHGVDPEKLPPILVVRAGTFNMLHNRLGGPASVLDAMTEWRKGSRSRLVEVPTLCVEAEGFESTYGFVFAWGIGFRVLRDYYSMRSYPTVVDGAVIAAKTFLSALHPDASNQPLFRAENVELEVDGQKRLDGDATGAVRGIVAGTIERLSLGMRPMCPHPPALKRFHVMATGLPLWKIAVAAPSLLWGFFRDGSQTPYENSFFGRDVQSASFMGSEGFTVDGEVFTFDGNRRISLRSGPTARFWVPPADGA